MTATRKLGGIEVTPIGLGCMQFAGTGMVERAYPALSDDQVRSVVGAALDGGITWFDTAEMYGRGHSERALTSALRALDVKPGGTGIATKWVPFGRTASSIVRTVDDRLAALQGYPIDLHQIHMPYGSLSSHRSQVEAMAKLRREGRIGAIGVSNFSARQMEAAARVLASHGLELASNQVQISLLRRDIERNGLLDAARRLGVTLIAYSPLRSGLLTGRFHDDPARLRSVSRTRRMMGGITQRTLARTAPLMAELRAIAEAHGATISQVSLAWLVTFYGDTVMAIPGASKPHHATESAGALDLRLTEKELARLDELSRPTAR